MFFDNRKAMGPILGPQNWMVVCVTSLETHTTTIHNVSNRRNSTPCRILRSRYGERNVPN